MALPPNKSPAPTAVGAFSFAIAVHVAGRRWFSFKTRHGARIGDAHMSLLHAGELHRVNPFDYLTALRQHAAAGPKAPESWLPWNCEKAIAAAGSG